MLNQNMSGTILMILQAVLYLYTKTITEVKALIQSYLWLRYLQKMAVRYRFWMSLMR